MGSGGRFWGCLGNEGIVPKHSQLEPDCCIPRLDAPAAGFGRVRRMNSVANLGFTSPTLIPALIGTVGYQSLISVPQLRALVYEPTSFHLPPRGYSVLPGRAVWPAAYPRIRVLLGHLR